MDIQETEEGLGVYLERLRQTAVTYNLAIGFNKNDPNNPYEYDIFVRDRNNNCWGYTVTTITLDLSSIFQVWKEIESLMMSLIKKR
jgi:hypothetical protein